MSKPGNLHSQYSSLEQIYGMVWWYDIENVLYYREIQKGLGRDTGLALFTISSRQDSTDNEIEIKVKTGAVLPVRDCKQSEPGVTTKSFLNLSVWEMH